LHCVCRSDHQLSFSALFNLGSGDFSLSVQTGMVQQLPVLLMSVQLFFLYLRRYTAASAGCTWENTSSDFVLDLPANRRRPSTIHQSAAISARWDFGQPPIQ
jgi:hypothetical protein